MQCGIFQFFKLFLYPTRKIGNPGGGGTAKESKFSMLAAVAVCINLKKFKTGVIVSSVLE